MSKYKMEVYVRHRSGIITWTGPRSIHGVRMKKTGIGILVIALALSILAAGPVSAQEANAKSDIEALKKTAPKIFIDCGDCDIDYIRTEITFVNYVRDRKEAQVHVLITTLRTGSGGREYTLSFIGQNEFAGLDDTQQYYSNRTDTQDEVRLGMVNALKMGLMGYVARTPISGRVSIDYQQEEKPKTGADKWKSWVFSLSGSGHFSGETSMNSRSLDASFSAGRVTPDIKIALSLSADYEKDHFVYEDETIDSLSKGLEFEGLVVRSLGDHWSAGAYVSAESSTYQNLESAVNFAPAIEFDLFPYSQSTRRNLRFLYKFGFKAVRYKEVTIFDKLRENLWNESVATTFEIKEKWGSISATLEGSHYFHDFRKNRMHLFTVVQLKLLKGLNAYVVGSGSRVRDQLSLVKGSASLDEVLLRRRQLRTNYNYFISVGLSYTFGSIFTNVVNPRFGSEGSGGIQISVND